MFQKQMNYIVQLIQYFDKIKKRKTANQLNW